MKSFYRAVPLCSLFTFLVIAPSAFAAVTPGQEQNRFEDELRERRATEELTEVEEQAPVEFADREPSEDAEAPRAADEDEESRPARAGEGMILPVRGKISVADLRRLVQQVQNMEDEGQVDVTISIAIGTKAVPGGSYAPSATSATEEFESGPQRVEDTAEQRALRQAERAAEKEAIAAGGQPLQEEVPFQVDRISVSGNSGAAVKDAEIRTIVAPFEGKQMKLSDAKDVAQQITNLYRSKGFLTSRAYIPPQKIETKTLEIRVFEGKLGKVKVRGNKFFKKRVIKNYFTHMKDKPLKFDDLKSTLTKLNMHPDREVKAVIVPGQVVGTSDLLLDMKDYRPIHIGAEVNNFGTEQTGKERYSISMRHNNLLGVDDIFAARGQFGEEVFAAGLQHTLPVGPYGTETGYTMNYTDVNVAGDFQPLDIAGRAWSGSVFVNHPIYDSERVDLTWTGSLEAKTIENTILGTQASKDNLRLVHTGVNADLIDPYGRTFIVNDFVWGVPWAGASDENDPRLSRRNSGAPFFKYDAAINRIHPVYDQTYAFFKGATQVSPDPMVSAEQFDIGGVYSVRGYPQSDYLGDQGVSGSAELRLPWYFLPKEYKAPHSNVPLWNRIHFVGFVDAAYASLRRPAVGERPSRTYIGAGGGLRVELPNNFLARFEWATPLANDPADGSNGQFYFTISSDLI